MSSASSPGPGLERAAELVRIPRAILFADMANSVRLLESDEEGGVLLWLGLVERLKSEILPGHKGRLVKMLGDGVLLEFDNAVEAVRVAFAIQEKVAQINSGEPRERRISMRMGLDLGDVIKARDDDIYGRHVNIAARLMSLAQPGEIVASAGLRDELASEMDAVFEDMGECILRNVSEPVHAFRVRPLGIVEQIRPILREEDLLPTVAVIPMASRGRARDQYALGDIVAEEVIVALSRSADLNVISRLSTSCFKMRRTPLKEIGRALDADYVLSGTYGCDGERIYIDVELAAVADHRVIWADHIEDSVRALVQKSGALHDIANRVQLAIQKAELRRAVSRPAATIESHALMVGAVTLMHRLNQRDFNLARDLLEALIERVPDHPGPRAWMARWHVLRVQQGWSQDPRHEGLLALQNTRRALDIDPMNVPALVAEGFVLTNLMHRMDEAEERYDTAIGYSPSDASGRLLRGTLHAFKGEGAVAMCDTEKALHLSPLDPNRYFFLSLAASACIAAGKYDRALKLAERSLIANRSHTSTLRVKAVAQMRLGDEDGGRRTVQQLLALQPGLTVGDWLRGSPSAPYEVGLQFAETLAEAGVPR